MGDGGGFIYQKRYDLWKPSLLVDVLGIPNGANPCKWLPYMVSSR